MADGLTTQSATPATVPASTVIATVETAADGHIQRMLVGGGDSSTTAQVGDSTSDTELLAANADRLGATLYNNSNATCYVKFGNTASTTDFSVAMSPGGYLEVPYGYRGVIDGVWSSDAGGDMKVTEFTS